MAVALDLGAYTAIRDYAGLVQKVKLWLDRGDDLDPFVPTFISLCEAYLNRTLRTPEMEKTAQAFAVDGAVALPLDFLQMRRVSVGGRTLASTSPAELQDVYGKREGMAQSYALDGLTLRIAPNDDGAVAMAYYARIPTLAEDAPNWLILRHPDVYLFGTLVQAEAYVDNPERVAQWEAAFTAVVEQVSAAGNKARWGGPINMRSGVARIGGVSA